MPIPENIKELAQDLHDACKRDLTPEQWDQVQMAMAGIHGVVLFHGDMGKVALSLCAADFAAEP